MSEYQYYEFRAIDRPLTQAEMTELRALSTRAKITSTRLQNVYHFGDFKGDPPELVERCFDAFVYVANWGTHELIFRLPRSLIDRQGAQRYAVEPVLKVTAPGDFVILDLTAQNDEGGDWVTDEEAEGWMPALLPLRDDLASGDLRTLYLAWLAAARAGELEDDETEPPVPPGLGALSAALKALAEFLYIDEDLLAVAAERSGALPQGPSASDLRRWIADLPLSEKDAWLMRLAEGNEGQLRAELLRRFRQATAPALHTSAGGRTVAELLSAAEERARASQQQKAAREAAERARQAAEQAAARAQYLASLAGREEELWRQVEALAETKRPKEYDLAVQLVYDLRALSARGEQAATFAARLRSLRARCANRPSLLQRLNRAGLQA